MKSLRLSSLLVPVLSTSRARRALPAAAVVFLAGIAARAQVVATSPNGYLNSVGLGATGQPFSARPHYRVQCCDESLRGTPIPNIIALNFRRDTAFSRSQNAARTVTVAVAMGHGSLAQFDEEFARNFTVDRSQVVASRVIALPNTMFAQNGGTQAEPWTSRIPLDMPFTYSGAHALLLEIATISSDSYVVEAGATTPGQLFNLSTGTRNEDGCQATGRTVPFGLFTTQYSHMRSAMMRLQADVRWGPAGAPVWLNISTQDPLLTLPGLCGRVHALPDVQLSLGTTNATGESLGTVVRFPWISALRSAPLYLQAMAFDAGQSGLPLVLSNDSVAVWPAAPTLTPLFASAHSESLTATRASALTTGGMSICGLER